MTWLIPPLAILFVTLCIVASRVRNKLERRHQAWARAKAIVTRIDERYVCGEPGQIAVYTYSDTEDHKQQGECVIDSGWSCKENDQISIIFDPAEPSKSEVDVNYIKFQPQYVAIFFAVLSAIAIVVLTIHAFL